MNKKKRLVVLVVIYIIVLIFTLSMECYGIREMVTRAVVNISTLAMALLCLGISLILSKGNPQRDEKESKESDEVTEDEPTFDKERYLEKAKEWQLTKRESEIGILVVNGYSNHQISDELYISETTVKKHMTHIYEKSNSNGRKDFVEKCLTDK
ncbi:MAG: LuxR C-terminal-related transcriptional regulator [Agathobacter sp.]|nr:LuxR C-terminal-related transcriptional regulator [Agathobacter sp.]